MNAALKLERIVTDAIRKEAGAWREPLPILPAPADLESEGIVLSSVLCGYASPAQLAPLAPRDFFSDYNKFCFTAMVAVAARGEPADLENVALELERAEVVGPVRDELRALRDCQPVALGTYLRSKVATILRHSLERRLLGLLGRIDARVRVGELSVDGARVELRTFFMENAG